MGKMHGLNRVPACRGPSSFQTERKTSRLVEMRGRGSV